MVKGKIMGLTYAEITLANGTDVDLAQTGRLEQDSVRKMGVRLLPRYNPQEKFQNDLGQITAIC